MPISIIDRNGQRQEFTPSLQHYQDAYGQGLTLRQYYGQTIDTDVEKYGHPFDQIMASAGIFVREDRATGIKPPTLAAILNQPQVSGAGIGMALTRPDGTNSLTITGRLLFPAVVMELAEAFLVSDMTSYNAIFESMVAQRMSIDSPHAFQPLINVTGPRASRAQPISQMAEPVNMATITLSERSVKLPTWSIGLEISDEAARATTLDLVGIAIREQSLGERAARVNEAIKAMVDGDTDLGITAISGVNASTFDSTLTSGTMTNKAWIKILRERWSKQTYSHMICSVDDFLAVESRTGRPIVTQATDTGRLTSEISVMNKNFPVDLPAFLLEDSSLLGAGVVVLLDKSKAMRKITYTGASYAAVENYVMRRSQAFRFDFSEGYFRMYQNDDGWRKVVLA